MTDYTSIPTDLKRGILYRDAMQRVNMWREFTNMFYRYAKHLTDEQLEAIATMETPGFMNLYKTLALDSQVQTEKEVN